MTSFCITIQKALYTHFYLLEMKRKLSFEFQDLESEEV